ncbi:unnamed protein product [Pedinophyceae sp. YPF-701]|nr:unnamed protein product [Pedinophyceae sp. YPF-701]
MRASLVWTDTPPEKDGVKPVCHSLAFSPDGTRLAAGAGSRVLVYDAVEGMLLHTLRGHKATVNAVAFNGDGKRFASGGADNTVIVWTSECQGLLKFTHNHSIQCLAYNPVTMQLASGTEADLGLWSPEQKSVSKVKVASKCVSVAWSGDGQALATGHIDGAVIIRDKAGAEKATIRRGGPAWSLVWGPLPDAASDAGEVLTVGSWDQQLAVFTVAGEELSELSSKLECAPNAMSLTEGGELMCVAGANKMVTLHSRDGKKLQTLVNKGTWIWACRVHPGSAAAAPMVAVGCGNGTVSVYNLVTSTVHALYQDRYAYRESMSDVVVHHLITDAKLRIRCRTYVRRISVYKDKLAVQMPSSVVIYELRKPDDPAKEPVELSMEYRPLTRLARPLECSLLVVTARHIVLCSERNLQMLTFDGRQERQWSLASTIRYIKVLGGPPGEEGLLVGLKDGGVYQVFLNNPFPVELVKHGVAVRCLDINLTRTRIALVDDEERVCEYSVATRKLEWSSPGATSVAFNSQSDSVLCYSSSSGQLFVKVADLPEKIQQRLTGFVVGFKGAKAFCLQMANMAVIDVPLTPAMLQYIERRNFKAAHHIACMGVAESDWRRLGYDALWNVELDVARKAFLRVHDVRQLDLVARIARMRDRGMAKELLQAEVLAFQGRYQEAARLCANAGSMERAIAIFSDLREFQEAARFAEELGQGHLSAVQELVERQAEWSLEMRDWGAAAEMYARAKRYDKAVALLRRHELWSELGRLLAQVPKTETAVLRECAQELLEAKQWDYAKEALLRLGDFRGLAQVYVETKSWDDAFNLLQQHKELAPEIYPAYARWLLEQGRFDEALRAFAKAGTGDAVGVLESLAGSAVARELFGEAAVYYHMLSTEHLKRLQTEPGAMGPADRRVLDAFSDAYDSSEVYWAYAFIHAAESQPFTTLDASTLFNASRFLYMRLLQLQQAAKPAPSGVQVTRVLHCLARRSEELGAWKLARTAWDRMLRLRVRSDAREPAEVAGLLARGRPATDAEDLQPVCWRCMQVNPLINDQGDFCTNCSSPFVRSFLTFEHLPLVPFETEPDISDAEAVALLSEEPPEDNVLTRAKQEIQRGQSLRVGGADVMRIDDGDDDIQDMVAGGAIDPFTAQRELGQVIRVDREVLRALRRNEVLVRSWPSPHVPCQFYRVMDADVPMCVGVDGHFYERDEYELKSLETGFLPFTKTSAAERGDEIDNHHPVSG